VHGNRVRRPRVGRVASAVGVAAALATAAGPAAAQQAGLLVLEAPSGTEAMAYGNAPWLFSRSADLLFQNPGLLGRAQGASAALQRYGGEGTLLSLAAAGSYQGGGFAAGVQVLTYETEPGSPAARDLQGVALTPGSIGTTELVGTLGYGRRLFGLELGAAVKYVEQSLDEARDRGMAFDLGIAREVGPLAIGLAVRDLGADLEVGGPTGELELPSRVVAGVSTRSFQVGELDMLLTSQATRRRDGEVIPAGGLEISYWPVVGYTFRLRAGLQRVVDDDRSPVTFGAAFTGDAITVEYAFESFDGEGDAHRFGLRWQP